MIPAYLLRIRRKQWRQFIQLARFVTPKTMSSKKNCGDGKPDLHAAASCDGNVCTRLTGAGRSAIAVIGVGGPASRAAVMQCFTAASPRELKSNEIRYGDWHGAVAESSQAAIPSESIVVIMRHEDLFEVHCHGGSAAIDRILADLEQVGITPVDNAAWPHPWPIASQDAVARPLLIREATDTLTQCQTVRTAAVAMDQVRGAMHDWAVKWLGVFAARRDADRAADLRFDRGAINDHLTEFHGEVQSMLDYASVTVRLTAPFRVVLAGRPNVGKSSLINAILGYDRSIATPVAGTTRDVLHAETIIDGLPIRLSDTAGIHDSDESIEREGISRALREASTADLVLAIQTPDTPAIVKGDSQVPQIEVLNKSDLLRGSAAKDVIQTVATTGVGIDVLLAAIANRLADAFPPPSAPAPLNERQVRCLETLRSTTETLALRIALGELVEG